MKEKAFTLIEMVVVVMIIGILTSILMPVLTNQILKARVARTKADIRTLEVAINRYMIDNGEYPPSGSYDFRTEDPSEGGDMPANPVATGSGLLVLALVHSIRANSSDEPAPTWDGPYISPSEEQLDFNGFPSGTRGAPTSRDLGCLVNGRGKDDKDYNDQLLDAFGEAFRYIRATDYANYGGTVLPADDPFYTSETWYNPRTYQLVSCGPNKISRPNPQVGLDADDIRNF